ncbi:MAG: protein O-mannosyl-transferase family [Hyphomicrobiales bacterium]
MVAAIAAACYARTLAPTVGAGDSGELILAARDLGVPHPPGYPLWLLFARLAAAIPLGPVALRVNAVSALFAALGAALLWLLARRAGLRPFGAAVATALFAGASLVWASAVEAEVYALATAAFLALLLLAPAARRAGARSREGARFFFAAGVALVAHQTLLFPAALLAVWILRRRFSVAGAAAGVGWAALGFSLVLVIPVRAAAHPSFVFSDARGLPLLVEHLLRQNYGGLAQNPFRLDRLADESAGMGGIVLASIGLAGAALAALGFFAAERGRPRARLALLAALTVPAALVLLIRFTPDAEHLAQVAPFLAPAVAATALFAGVGADRLRVRGPAALRPAAAVATAALVAATVAWHFVAADRSGFRLAERYAEDLLAGLPRGATLVLDGDNESFLAAYATRVQGERPDLRLIQRRGYLFGDAYGLAGAPRARWAEIADRKDRERIVANRSPVYFASPPAGLIGSGIRFAQRGIVYRAEGPAEADAPDVAEGAGGAIVDPDGWQLPARWPRSTDLLPGGPARYDYVTRKMAVTYSDAAARWLWDRGRLDEALPWFEDAARVGYDFPGAHVNLATAAAATGDPDRALDEFLRAATLAPYDPEPSARLAVFLASAGRPREAALWFEKAFRAAPGRALAADAAHAWTIAGDRARARLWNRRAAALAERGAAPATGEPEGGEG